MAPGGVCWAGRGESGYGYGRLLTFLTFTDWLWVPVFDLRGECMLCDSRTALFCCA